MTAVLALDQGTTGSTALVIADDGRVLGRAYRELTQHFPAPGLVEHDAAEIWRITIETARLAVEQAGEQPVAIGITNQRETVVAWDRRTGEPLHRAIVWQDRRTTERCRALRESRGDGFIGERTGLVWDPYFSGTKIEWLLEHVPDLRARADGGDAVFGTVDAWLTFRLTEGRAFVTDHTNASRTLLYDVRRRDWSPELLELFDVPRHALPAIVPSAGVVGETAPGLFPRPVPIAGMAGDQQAALFGQGGWESGRAKCTYGTGAFLLMEVGADLPFRPGEGGLLTTVACGPEGQPVYALEGSIFVAGAAVQWLRDGLGIITRAAETEALARSVADTGGVYFVPALVGLGAPHWEPKARGTIVGLTRGTNRAHLVRAALEAMAYGTREVVETMSRVARVPLEILRVDGGATANDWLMQFQADVLGVPVARPDLLETTSVGAAGLAGLAVGAWPDAESFLATRRYQTFVAQRPVHDGYREWRRAVEAALHWARFAAEGGEGPPVG